MKEYRIKDRAGMVLYQGTADRCAAYIGMTKRAFYCAAYGSRNGSYKRYIIDDVSNTELDQEAIRNWDAFTQPLRKKYGIPVYRRDENE